MVFINTISDNVKFINNTAYYEIITATPYSCGGAIYYYKSSYNTISNNVTFKGNNAKDRPYSFYQGYGGAIYYDLSNYNSINNVLFDSNSVNCEGGAIYYRESKENQIINADFINNIAEYSRGGAIGYEGDNLKCDIINSTFKYNNASFGAAVAYFGNNTASNIINSTFMYNCAFAEGSAIYVEGQSPKLTNCTLLENKARVTGLSRSLNSNCTELQIRLSGGNSVINAISSNSPVTLNNVTYWGANGVTVSPASDVVFQCNSNEAGQNVSLVVRKDVEIILNLTDVTDDDGNIIISL